MAKGRYRQGAPRPDPVPPWPDRPGGPPVPPGGWAPGGPAMPPGGWAPAAPRPVNPAASPDDPYAAPPAQWPPGRHGLPAPPTPVWVGVALVAALTVLSCGVLVLGVYSWWTGGPLDRHEPVARPIHDARIVAAATAGCDRLNDALADTPDARTAGSGRAVWLRAENDAIAELVDTVRAVGSERLAADESATRWVADWAALAAARDGYAAALDAGGSPAWRPPVGADGADVVERIDAVGVCRVPPRLYDW